MDPSADTPRRCRRRDWFPWALAAAVAVSRLALLSPGEGEPDSARFVIGVWQWLRFGPHPPRHAYTFAYYSVLAPGYFALVSAVERCFRPAPDRWPLLLNGLSAAAAVASAPLIYFIGRRLVCKWAARSAAIIFLFSPGYWWLGLEAHPQCLAFLLLLAALAAFSSAVAKLAGWDRPVRWRPDLAIRLGAAALCLVGSLLLRGDQVLLIGLFPVLALWRSRPNSPRGWARAAALCASVPALGVAGFLLARSAILGDSLAGASAASVGLVRRFWGDPSLIHQLTPVVTAPGPVVALAAALALAIGCLRVRASHRLVWLAAAMLPGLAFWLCVTGNNVRHVIEFWLPLLWAATAATERLRPRLSLYLGAGAMLAGGLLLPANSNLTLYPSPNVWGSQNLLARRERQMARTAAALYRAAEGGTSRELLQRRVNQSILVRGAVAALAGRGFASCGAGVGAVPWPLGRGARYRQLHGRV